MADIFKLYISTASDLLAERDLLSRSVTEIPVSLIWQINFSPIGEKKVDEELIQDADVHILILGTDIRAPIGYEWHLSRHLGRRPLFFRKKGISRTLAAQTFYRSFSNYGNWCIFESLASLRFQALKHITQTILDKTAYFDLKQVEFESLSSFIDELDEHVDDELSGMDRVAGEDSIIFSRERFTPKGGVLIKDAEDSD